MMQLYTANFYPMKTTETGNYRVPARRTCRENLHYLWKRAVQMAGKSHDNHFPCKDPVIPSPRSFHEVKICRVQLLDQKELQKMYMKHNIYP